MKNTVPALVACTLSFIWTTGSQAQDVFHSDSPVRPVTLRSSPVVERGANFLKCADYTILQSGLHRRDSLGNWVESNPVLTRYAEAIVGEGAPIRVILSTNLLAPAVVDLEYPSGDRVVLNPIAIVLYDPESNESTILATVTNASAELLSPTQVIYRNAFHGSVSGSVLLTYEKGRFSQNVVIESQVLDSNPKARLEIATEIISSSGAIRHIPHVIRKETNAVVRAQMLGDPDIVDEEISFGAARFGMGWAFGNGQRPRGGVPVSKRVLEIEGGRRVLLESIELNDPGVREAMEALPVRTAHLEGAVRQASLGRKLPVLSVAQPGKAVTERSFASRLARISSDSGPMLASSTRQGVTTQVQIPPRGYTVDYEVVIYEEDYRFAAGSTTVVTNAATVINPIFERSAVVKASVGASLSVSGWIEGPYWGSNQMVFTAIDDDSIGANVDGVGSTISGRYADIALGCYYVYTYSWGDLDIRHAETGLFLWGGTHEVANSFFYECDIGTSGELSSLTLTSVDWCEVSTTSDAILDGDLTETGSTYCQADRDSDGLPDNWEFEHFGNLVQSPSGDFDGDGLTNLQEYQLGLNPADQDSDDDGIIDQLFKVHITRPSSSPVSL